MCRFNKKQRMKNKTALQQLQEEERVANEHGHNATTVHVDRVFSCKRIAYEPRFSFQYYKP